MISIYKRFNEFDQVTGKIEVVTTGLWTGDTGSLHNIILGSQPQSSSVITFIISLTPSNGEVQYAGTYGHISGSGSKLPSQR